MLGPLELPLTIIAWIIAATSVGFAVTLIVAFVREFTKD